MRNLFCYEVTLDTTNVTGDAAQVDDVYLSVDGGVIHTIAATAEDVGAVFHNARCIRRVGRAVDLVECQEYIRRERKRSDDID